MNELLLYILKSTFCISLFYIAFRTVMHKETFFTLNRALLLAVIICSTLIPLVNLPEVIQPKMHEKLMPAFPVIENQLPEFPVVADPPKISGPVNVMVEKPERAFPFMQLIGYIYLAGMLISLLILIHGLVTLLLLFRKAQVQNMEGFKLLIIEKDIHAFSFCRMIFISRTDYSEHGSTILAHEQQHIRLGHFYDLMLLEMAKMIHWFNPIIYWLIQDLKAIHEYQADKHTLTTGIDATKYQLLIIEKGVGPQRLALANSFNHCQIKNRITMMNKQKTSKAWRWKVATFLPLLALLLMAFGKPGENVSIKDNVPLKVIESLEIVQVKPNDQKGFSIEIRKDGNYIDNKLFSKEEMVKWTKTLQKTNEEILLIVDNQIPYDRVDEVRKALENAKIYHVNQKSPNSDEIIYPAGDVTELAKFTQGKWSEWMKNQLKNLSEGKSDAWTYKIMYSFIIDKDGKVKDGHLMKGSDNPEINAAFEKCLTQIPDWKPAKKGNKEVSVFYRAIFSQYAPPPTPPNKDEHIIKINNDSSLSYNNSSHVSFDELADIVKKELRQNPKLKYNIWIEEGKIDERLDKIKNILKTNGNPEVHFFSFYTEKVPGSEGKSSTITLKPLRSSKSFTPHVGSDGK